MPEPSCAALAFIAEQSKRLTRTVIVNQRKVLLVFDLGGGTFDIAIVKLFEDFGIQVLCVEGTRFIITLSTILLNNTWLYTGIHTFGGDDIDRAMVNQICVPWFNKEHGIFFEGSDPALLILQSLMQEAKQLLSLETEVQCNIAY